MTRWIFIIFTLIALIIIFFFALLMITPSNENEEPADISYNAHVQIIVKDSGEYFWSRFQDGAVSAGEERGVYVEIVPQSLMTGEELQRLLESGAYAGVDGIALQPLDLQNTDSVVDSIAKEGIHIVTYESGAGLLSDVPTVGSNYFNVGKLAGQMVLESIDESVNVQITEESREKEVQMESSDRSAKILVLLNKNEAGDNAQQQNTMIQGIMDSTGHEEDIEIIEIVSVDPEKFEAENVVQQRLSFDSEIDTIICLDEKSTPAVAQTVVDNGYVGRVVLIGYGAMPQTLDYISRGVIFGSIFPDAYETGYKTVELLSDMIDGGQVSNYTNPTLHRIDKDNADEYTERQTGE